MNWFSRPSTSIIIVLVLSLAIYANTLGHEFVWDDNALIVENPLIQSLDSSAILDIFTVGFWEVMGSGGPYYRPLVTLSYAIDHEVFAGRPGGFHLTNVVWNALTCVMVFVFVHLLFGNTMIALATALLFAVHPVHTEAVAWVAGRTDVFAAFWSLVALTTYVLARRSGHHLLLFASLFAFFLSLLSKECAVCVPLLIALMELSPMATIIRPRSDPPARPNMNRSLVSIAYVASYFVVLALYFLLRYHTVGTVTSSHDAYAPGILGVLAVPLSVFAGYVYKLLLPIRLSAEYDAPIPSSLADAPVLIGAVLVVMIGWIAWRYRRTPFLFFGIAVFVIGIAAVLNIVPIGEVSAERFLYFPSLGAALVFGGIFGTALVTKHKTITAKLARRDHTKMTSAALVRFLVILFPIIIVVSVSATVARNAVWRNEITLFANTMERTPNNARAYALFANAALSRGDVDSAIRAYRKALALDPANPNTRNLLAGLYVRQGKLDDALRLVRQALEMSPDDPQFVSNLGSIYLEMGRYAEAEMQFKRALELNPNQLRTHFNLGITLLKQGKAEIGREYFVRALQGGAEFNMANYYLAVTEISMGDSAQARAYARRFLEAYHPDDSYRQTAQSILVGRVAQAQP
ncbi:MAG: tetratricopeptide repeat protein [Candidatus Latescibacterota bacterium]|nr:MAG: tetratricopeptide repeat protein [Candidatus Latescibacterota bacterium]